MFLDCDDVFVGKLMFGFLDYLTVKLKNETRIVFARMDVTTNDLPRPYYIKG